MKTDGTDRRNAPRRPFCLLLAMLLLCLTAGAAAEDARFDNEPDVILARDAATRLDLREPDGSPLDVRMDPSMSGTFETPINILSTVSGMSVPLLLFANFALILNASEGYHRQLIRYLLTLSGVAALSIFLYERYIIGSAAVLLGSREMAESALEILFRISVPSGFAAYNLFVDLFLCALLMFFMNYRPKHVFKGRALVFFRLFSLIPILYEVASFVLKVLSIEGKIRLPMIVFPFLTVKPPVTFLVFIILVLYIKNRERRFLRHDRSLEDYQKYRPTGTPSISPGSPRSSWPLRVFSTCCACSPGCWPYGSGIRRFFKTHQRPSPG